MKGFSLISSVKGRGESPLDTLQVLLTKVVGVDLPSKVKLAGSMVAIDRGYMGPEMIHFLNGVAGADIIGTHKRIASFPFTFGDKTPKPTQQYIAEKGAKSVYFAKKKWVMST